MLPKTFKNRLKKLACKVPKFQATVVDLPDIVPLACGFLEEALEPGGAIQILGHTLDDSRLATAHSLSMNLFFINAYDDGQAYTEQEH